MTNLLQPQRGSRKPFTRSVLWLFASLGLALSASSCNSTSPDSAAAVPVQTYYAKFAIRVDGNKVRSTNYRNSDFVMIPINTPVELESTRRNVFNLKLEGSRTFTFEHIVKHTMDAPKEAFESFFSPQPVNLGAFSAKDCDLINEGEIAVGMTRDAVLASIGPPPASGTLLLSSDAWKYWNHKFSTFYVRFDDNGRVASIGK